MAKLSGYFAIAIWAVVFNIGCFEIVAPDAELPDGSEISTEPGASCNCSVDKISGRVFRFTEMKVIEPESIRSSLDDLWRWEISKYLLNVLFVVEDASKSDADSGGFSDLRFTVGPGWRKSNGERDLDDLFVVGTIDEDEIDNYCLLDEKLNVDVQMSSIDAGECNFVNNESKALYFHIGNKSNPLMCAPLLEPRNTTPLHNLQVLFHLNEDCSKLVDGYLDGCLPQESVNKICMCGTTGLCTRDGNEDEEPFPEANDDGEFETTDLRDYCTNTCGVYNDETGQGWTSYRALMDTFSNEPSCIAENGQPGYRLRASFTAEDISKKYSSDMSVCADE